MLAAFLLRLAFWIYTNRTWEDALITVLHSENFYRGLGLTHFRIDDPRPLHGFTSPISLLIPLLADGFHIGWGLPFLKFTSLLAGPVAVWFGYRIVRQYLAPSSLPAAVLGAGYIAIEHHQIMWGIAGMETQLATAALLAGIYFLLSENIVASGITSGLCLLARPDFVLWVVIAAATIGYRSYRGRSFKPLITFATIVFLIYGPWLVFTTLYYGSPIPNTIVAKRLGYYSLSQPTGSAGQAIVHTCKVALVELCAPLQPTFGGNGTGFLPLMWGQGILRFWLAALCVVLVAVGFIFDVVHRRWQLLPVYAFLVAFAAFMLFGAPIRFEWYVIPFCAILALLLGKAVADIAALLPPRYGNSSCWIVAGAYLAGFAVVLPTTFAAERNIQNRVENKVRKAIGIYLSHTPWDTTIAGEPLGYIGYYSQRTYYDYPGLCSRKVVRWLKTQDYSRPGQILRLWAYLRPDYLVVRKFEYLDFQHNPDGAFLDSDYHLVREFAVTEEDGMKLFHPASNIDLDFLLLARNTGLPRN